MRELEKAVVMSLQAEGVSYLELMVIPSIEEEMMA